MEIIWKSVPEFNNYEVSEFGEVRRTVDSYMPNGYTVKYPKGMILKTKRWNKHGYPTYRLTDGEKNKTFYAHRLVALAFLNPPPEGKYEVCHYDGDRMNNHFSNLRWGTHKENFEDAVRHGTMRGRK